MYSLGLPLACPVFLTERLRVRATKFSGTSHPPFSLRTSGTPPIDRSLGIDYFVPLATVPLCFLALRNGGPQGDEEKDGFTTQRGTPLYTCVMWTFRITESIFALTTEDHDYMASYTEFAVSGLGLWSVV